jgi:hypothetical protein
VFKITEHMEQNSVKIIITPSKIDLLTKANLDVGRGSPSSVRSSFVMFIFRLKTDMDAVLISKN